MFSFLGDLNEFQNLAAAWHKIGCKLIGGCCRTTPSHIHDDDAEVLMFSTERTRFIVLFDAHRYSNRVRSLAKTVQKRDT
jgi:hypothetical protein